MDLVKELGVMAFASRLSRLSDRLKADATTLYHHRGVDFNDKWFLIAYMLSKNETMTVAEIAKALGVSRPSISQDLTEMANHGLITVQPDERDRRKRLLSLTYIGKEAVAALEPVWKAVGDCTCELLTSTGKDIMKAISDIERELERRSLFSRVVERLYGSKHEHALSS